MSTWLYAAGAMVLSLGALLWRLSPPGGSVRKFAYLLLWAGGGSLIAGLLSLLLLG